MSNSLWPHRLQHARLPCPSPAPGACSNMSIELVMPSKHLILCCPLLLLPSIFPSIRVFSNESVLHIRRPKYWIWSFSISPFSEYSFRMDWLDLLAVQGTLKSLFQHHSSKASILWHSALFIVQLSHPYLTTGKILALTRRILVGKVVSLLFNMLSKLVIAFLLRSKGLFQVISFIPSNVIAFIPSNNIININNNINIINSNINNIIFSSNNIVQKFTVSLSNWIIRLMKLTFSFKPKLDLNVKFKI